MTHQFYYSGPLLYHTELNENDLNSLKKICLKDKTKDFRKDLAGHLDHEYAIDTKKFNNIIDKYLLEYYQTFEHWYGKKIINFMKSGEYNPPHIHSNCNLSCVIYLDVPLKLKNENKKYIGTIKNGGPGSINFIINTKKDDLFIGSKVFFPKNGDFFIFHEI